MPLGTLNITWEAIASVAAAEATKWTALPQLSRHLISRWHVQTAPDADEGHSSATSLLRAASRGITRQASQDARTLRSYSFVWH